jgi:hypothetical protein
VRERESEACLRANPPQAPEVDAGPDELSMLMTGAASDGGGPAPAPAGGAAGGRPRGDADDAVIGPMSASTNCVHVPELALQYRPIQNVCILMHSCRICLHRYVLVCIGFNQTDVLVCIDIIHPNTVQIQKSNTDTTQTLNTDTTWANTRPIRHERIGLSRCTACPTQTDTYMHVL